MAQRQLAKPLPVGSEGVSFFFPALNEWERLRHQTARVGRGIYCLTNEEALMNQPGWEWDTPLFFQIPFIINNNINFFKCYLYCKASLCLELSEQL